MKTLNSPAETKARLEASKHISQFEKEAAAYKANFFEKRNRKYSYELDESNINSILLGK